MSGFDNGEIGGWVWQWRDRWVALKEAMVTGLVCRSEIVLVSRWCRFVAKTMMVRWGWGLNLRHDQTGEGWARSKIMLLGFEDGGFGIYDFFLMVILCWILWVYEFGSWVYEFYLLEVSLLIERWENLGLSYDFVYLGFVVWENLRRSIARFVFVFLLEIDLSLYLVDKKGQENASKSGHVFLCLKSGSMFFGVLVEDEHRSWFFFFIWWVL